MNQKTTVALCTLTLTLAIAGTAEAYSRYNRYRSYRSQPRQSYVQPQRSYYDPRQDYAYTRGHNGTLTERNIYEYRQRFDYRQGRAAMDSALGLPAEWTDTSAKWRVQRTDERGQFAGYGYLHAEYDRNGNHQRSYVAW